MRIYKTAPIKHKILNTIPDGQKCTGTHPIITSVGIRMFVGLPDPDPFVRGMDPDPDTSLFSLRC
jgi:hypothetical protein